MNPYQEIVEGRTLVRSFPGARHERICAFLHERVGEGLAGNAAARLLGPRDAVCLSPRTTVRPDLALVTVATGKVWLVVEIIDSADHRADTVLKKELYEEFKVPRVWMVDPRYDNVEFYHGTPHGLALKGILAGREILQEGLLPGLAITVAELFAV
ncbi:MAG TPA: Uma2 family endonuclease [Candidatus Acidoferrum sp.]|nr:Uma2 family endonuclease [Candidatus Acidoferrum sp.]